MTGRIDRHLSETVLYEQAFVKDPDHTIADLVGEAVHRLGENIVVGRFVRFAVGESDDQVAVSG